ncbi:DUF202 domain-containing protein [Clavibacter michiganensis]|uniref:DUF202 domain-containing protein n=1 Tax=Clavibacter michiganensis TaxID=28447 RepID=A0A2S5VWM8_9MICO|nr:DUF202 domain-containing protein [Clavibacter michiganensis]PPF70441.1 DUF202 domain-containing protein [Clavibacter michiganensis]
MSGPDAARGERPYDPGLQPERTALAWRRTALALVVGSLLGLRALPAVLGAPGLALAFVGVALALSVLVTAHRRYRRVHRILTTRAADPAAPPGAALPGGALPALVAALTAVAGLAALAVALVR